ncbi:MAG TPA: helix-turn-helix domain-containing protein, partial [Porticoccaceae bacterium]
RKEDIPRLVQYFLNRSARDLEVEPKVVSPEAERHLANLPWPGNVRQLENTCRWLTVMASGREILLSDLPPELMEEQAPSSAPQTSGNWELALRQWAVSRLGSGQDKILDTALPAFERIMIEAALERTGGRKKEAAELLGWGRNTLTRKLKDLGMAGSDVDGESEEEE